MSTITVHNGEATITPYVSNYLGTFLGSTSSEGVFPQVGLRYSQFSFAPAVGAEGILVFAAEAENHFVFYSYFWKQGFLVVKMELPDCAELFSTGRGENNFGLMVRTKTRTYVTNVPEGSDAAYLLVDPVVLMKYVDGKITIEQLHRNARTVKDREKRYCDLLKINTAHRQTIQRKNSRIVSLEHQNQVLEQKVLTYGNLLKDLVRKLRESLFFSFFFPEDLAVRLHELDIAEN